uniref:Uncharacterized protein n=1 Tax=Globisporangium ultimum (strain ATCC 200006 / CBS 805.95 / DAOM BR144) TaxID=431595 RepID=K3XBR8_GLOUD
IQSNDSAEKEDAPNYHYGRFLADFDDNYVANVVRQLNRVRDPLLDMKLVFGTKWLRLYGLRTGIVYDAKFVRSVEKSHHIASLWSNMCNLQSTSPTIKALVNRLQEKAEVDTSTERVLRMDVYVKCRGSRQDDLRVCYRREYSEWTLESVQKNIRSRYAFDISLGDQINFRVRECKQIEVDAARADCVGQELCIQELMMENTTNGSCNNVDIDTFRTSVEFVQPLEASRCFTRRARIESVRVQSEVEVPYQGLKFTLRTLKDNEFQLEAQIADRAVNAVMTLGERFQLLVERIHSVLSAFAESG